LNKYILLIAVLLGASCAQRTMQNGLAQANKSGYDSRFPQTSTSPYLKQISESVKLVSSLTFYKKYHFAQTTHIRFSFLKRFSITQQARSTSVVQAPSSGTATIIYATPRKIALLTCAHIVRSPDTLFTYFKDSNGQNTKFIRSMAVKIRQSLNVIDLPRNKGVTVLAQDAQNDLALLGVQFKTFAGTPAAVFDYPLGNAAELDWGTFVYLLGFPFGKKVVTSAIISHPNRNARHDFIINSNMYRGISGGIILAIRGGLPHFELVGLANALPVRKNLVLRPNPDLNAEEVIQPEPYSGKIFIDQQVSIVHGLTLAISSETIRRFIRTNLIPLKKRGFDLNGFIKKAGP